tara:strand:- start:845 stop:1009 length:165 start_codon:yes stop_codon:yes gene_type:complete
MRRLEELCSSESSVLPTQVIGQDEDDVRRRGALLLVVFGCVNGRREEERYGRYS